MVKKSAIPSHPFMTPFEYALLFDKNKRLNVKLNNTTFLVCIRSL